MISPSYRKANEERERVSVVQPVLDQLIQGGTEAGLQVAAYLDVSWWLTHGQVWLIRSQGALSSLHLADDNQLRNVAFPAISTGIFGYPVERCAQTPC